MRPAGCVASRLAQGEGREFQPARRRHLERPVPKPSRKLRIDPGMAHQKPRRVGIEFEALPILLARPI